MKRNHLKTLAIVFASVMMMGVLTATAYADSITIDLPAVNVTVTKDAEGYAKFSGTGIQFISPVGAPAIPYLVVKALLPSTANLATVQVTVPRENVVSNAVGDTWEVRPMPEPAVNDDTPAPIQKRDNTIYSTSVRYPETLISNVSTGSVWGWLLADIPIALYQYNPVTKRIFTLSSNQAVITFEHKTALRSDEPPAYSPVAEERVRNLAVNFNQMASEYPAPHSTKDNTKSSYVIITTRAIQSASTKLTDFIKHKESRNFTVRVITEDAWGGGTGNTASENIRNWLKTNYQLLNIEYVLLIGNPNPASGDVPMKMLWPRNNATYELTHKESPSDFYYADLNGNWDLNNNGKYGEYEDFGPGGVDKNYEVIVGRIPYYGNKADLDSILTKTIAYQNDANQNWRKKVLLPMEQSDAFTPGYHLGEAIKNNVLVPKGWSYHRIYHDSYNLDPSPETISVCPLPPPWMDDCSCGCDKVTTAWKSSYFGATFWWTHGSETGAYSLTDASHAASLDNNHPAFVFQCSCTNAHPETTNNLSYSLLKNGAIATIGATRVSWYLPGWTDFPGTSFNTGMTYEYAKRLIGNEAKSGGWALHDMKQTLTAQDRECWMNFTDFNLYGDPEVALMSNPVQDNPPTISDIPEQNTTRDTEITVNFTIGDDITPAADLIVSGASSDTTLVPNGNIVFGGSVADRAVKITPAPSKKGSVNITLTVKDGASKTTSKTFLLTVNELAGWHWDNPIPMGNNLHGVWADSANSVYAVGDGGKILYYNGSTGIEMATDVPQRLESVWGSSESNIFAVGWGGIILRYDGTVWKKMESGIFTSLRGIWGSSANDIFAVGDYGTVLHYDGTAWKEMRTGTVKWLNSVWGSSANNVFAVGRDGVILHYDGNSWTEMQSVTTQYLSGVWGTSANDVFAVGGTGFNGVILRYNGSVWTNMDSGTTVPLSEVWGTSANNVFAVDLFGKIFRYDGSKWTKLTETAANPSEKWGINGVAGSGFVYAVGRAGIILRYDGNSWSTALPKTANSTRLSDIWGSSYNDVFAVGDNDAILHYDGNSWVKMPITTGCQIVGVKGISSNSVFAINSCGDIYRYNGAVWEKVKTFSNIWFQDIWITPDNNVFVIGIDYFNGGNSKVIRFDGNIWSEMTSFPSTSLYSVWGSSGQDVFVAGIQANAGVIFRYYNSTWTKMELPTGINNLYGIWGSSSVDVFAVGDANIILHYDGTKWTKMQNPNGMFYGVWGNSGKDVFVVGRPVYNSDGSDTSPILHYDGRVWTEMTTCTSNEMRSVWGSSGSNIFAVGEGGTIIHYTPPTVKPVPILSVLPAFQSVPAAGGTTTFNVSNAGTGTITWQAAENEPWFSITPGSGGNSGTITVNYDANPGDVRTGYITVTAAGAENSPKTVEVRQAAKSLPHFTKLWTGNPYNPMSVVIVGANVNGVKLSVGDEIGVFDGTKCVGFAIVNGDIDIIKRQFLNIVASQDDGSGNGFVNGHQISFRIWKANLSTEYTDVRAFFKNTNTGDPTDPVPFDGMGECAVALEVGSTQQNIALSNGWNLMSSYLTPQNADMMAIVQPLINSGCLEKVISESGGSILKLFGNWTNTIGNYNPAEGYKIKTKCNTSLSISGGSVLAQSNMYASSQSRYVKLSQGWNIVSYPFANGQNAMSAVQPLIDSGKLMKVIDEKGGTVIKLFGSWMNNIGNLMPGEGYEIKVSADADWIMKDSASSQSVRDNMVVRGNPTVHFTPVWTGNPYNRMNLWLGSLQGYGVEAGDEVAIFDGSTCVGAAVVSGSVSQQNMIQIIASQNDGSSNGFTNGHAITLKFWDASQNKEITDICPQFTNADGVAISAPVFAGTEDYALYLTLNCSNPTPTRIIGLTGNLAFGDVNVGTTKQLTFTVSNTGNSALTVNSINYPAGFSGNWNGGPIPAGGSQSVTVTFMPTLAQSYSGMATVNSDKTDGVNTILISGSGSGTQVTRIIALNGSLNFGNIQVGTSRQLTLTISNSGNSALTVNSINYPAGFSGNWNGGPIPAGGSQSVTVTFMPTLAQSYSGMVTVNSDKTDGVNTIAISGTAYAASKAVREMPWVYDAGKSLTIYISVTPSANVLTYSIEENPPGGWVVSNVSDGGAYDSINRKVKFFFYDNQNRRLSYQVTPPFGTSGTYTFSGVALFNGTEVQITGNTSVYDNSIPALAGDVNGDGMVDLADAITALQILAGINPLAYIRADVNNDGKIGIEETVYILQMVAGLRDSSSLCTYSISSNKQSFTSSAGTGGVNVTTTSGCNWTATSSSSWLTVTSGTSGNGSGTVAYSVLANPNTTSRTGMITIAGQTFTVTQAGIICSYSISSSSQSFMSSAGTGSVNVTTTSGCNWTATSNATSWLTITYGSSGSGNGTVSYSVAANSGTTSRTGTITIAGQTFTVTQAGIICSYSISSGSQSFTSSAGTGSVNVTTTSGCNWTATSNASWLTVTSGANGSGNGTVNYSVAQNIGSSRTGILTIGGQVFTVTQDGCSPYCPLQVTISGKVIDSLNNPIDGINIAITQSAQRVDVYSDINGDFQTSVPNTGNSIWNAQIVGIMCTSRIMDPTSCNLKGYFELKYYMDVDASQSQPAVFIFEKATTVIKGKISVNGIRIFAIRSDGARSWISSSDTGDFELPASAGSWDVYAVSFTPSWKEGQHIKVEIIGTESPTSINLSAP